MAPRITIAIPTYRRTALLLRAVESALAAKPSGADLSIIVVDNCSPESPVRPVGERFGDAVRVLVNERNLGMPGNWSRCRQHAQATGADYWMLLEDDNLLEPGFLEAGVEALESDPDADVFFSACTYFDDEGRTTPWGMWSVDGGPLRTGHLPHRELAAWVFTCAMRASAVLVRNTPALHGLPVFDEDHFANHDVSGLGGLAIAARGVRYDERPLMRYYVNPISMTSTVSKDPRVLFAELLRALRSNARALAITGRLDDAAWRGVARHAPLDRLMVAVLATEPGGAPELRMPHRALIEGLVPRAGELKGLKRWGSRLLGPLFWRAVAWASRGRLAPRRSPGTAGDYAGANPAGAR